MIVPTTLIALPVALAPAALAWLLLAAPLLEEMVFRAGLHEALLRRGWPAVRANGAVGLAFAAAHLALRPGWLAAATVVPALAIGAVYQRQRRLAPCVALHAAFNAAFSVAGWLLVR